MEEITTIPEVFIFCWYPESWMPRAIIADISKFNDEAMEQINIINGYKSNIFYRSEKITSLDNEPYVCKSKIVLTGLDNEPIAFDDKTMMIFNTWISLADHHYCYIHKEENNLNHWIHHSREYYINDVNSNLSPVNLHCKLWSLTCHPQDSTFNFKVKHCVLFSDVPLSLGDELTVKSLRFFYTTDEILSEEDTKNILMKVLDVNKLIIATGQKYGFLQPKNYKQWEQFNKRKFKVGPIKIIFD